MARKLDDGIWVFDRPLRVWGLAIGTRMTAVRLPDGGLFLHSPVAPDARTRAELEEFGPVRFVVAPNRAHHLDVGSYRSVYPDASIWAAPGLPEKRGDVVFDGVLSDRAQSEWSESLDQLLVEGIPILNEVVFLHRASRTLLLTDLAMNHTEGKPLLTSLWLRLNGTRHGFSVSRLVRALVRDRAAARRSLDRILEWDFERVVVTHGIVLPSHGRRLFREIWSWLEP